MKKMKFILIALCVTAISWGSCNHNSEEIPAEETPIEETPADEIVDCDCECNGTYDRIVIVLKDEPAYVRKGQFPFIGGTDTLIFTLLKAPVALVPCCEVPQNYQIDGLMVLISGNKTSCWRPEHILPSAQQTLSYKFELTSIKMAK